MKRLLIVGGSGKIGSALSLHFIRSNYKLIVTYNKSLEKINELKKSVTNSSNFYTFQWDVLNLERVDVLRSFVESRLGELDVLINCAGIFPKKDFKSITDREFDEVMSIHLKSSYFLIKTFFDLMTTNSTVINFSSIGGIIPWKNRSLYHISKSSVIALTKSLALECAPKVRVNSIAPGYIEFNENEAGDKMPLSKIPLQRYGKIDHIIQTIEFLINNDYITGVTIPIDGGRLLV